MTTKQSGCMNLMVIPVALSMIVVDIISIYWMWGLWFDEPIWGWSFPQKRDASILFVLMLATHVILFFLWQRRQTYLYKTLMTGVISIVLLIVCIYVISNPPSHLPVDERLAELGINPSAYSTLPACKKINTFADVGYDHLSIEPRMLVLVPAWMDQALVDIPKDVLRDCIYRELEEQLPYLEYDNQMHEVALKKIHVLLIKAWELGIVDDPQILELENVIVCKKRDDPYGQLSLVYYVGLHGTLPSFNYFGEDGIDRLHTEVCGK